jgi:hypothetical protein
MKVALRTSIICLALLQAWPLFGQPPARPYTPADFRSAKAPYNPKPFQNNPVSPSAPVLFLLSDRGKALAAHHPNVRGLFSKWGVSLPASAPPIPTGKSAIASPAPTPVSVSTACNTPAGAKFNLEPASGSPGVGFAVPQNEQSVDFLRQGGIAGSDLVIQGSNDYRGIYEASQVASPLPNSWGFGDTGYYVHRTGSGCAPDFEGALPSIVYQPSGEILYSAGDPVIAVDATRNKVYAADLRFGGTVTGLGLFATTVAGLNDATTCPNGTHLTGPDGKDTTAARCWPMQTLVNAQSDLQFFSDKPHMRPDERISGVGAGDVYVTWTNFDLTNGLSQIEIEACNFSTVKPICSPAKIISAGDTLTQFSHIAVRPDGVVTLTYINLNIIDLGRDNYFRQTFDIKYLSCTPNGAPKAPTCSSPSLITTELQPLVFGGSLVANYFRVDTYPVHDQRLNGDHYDEFVVWSRCKADPYFLMGDWLVITCNDADLVMTSSATDGAGNPLGWSPIGDLTSKAHDQLMPWIKTDHSRDVVNISFLSAERDPNGHLLQVVRTAIDSGSTKSNGSFITVTPTPADPAADFFLAGSFIGDYIGMAVKGDGQNSRVYFGFTGQIYEGVSMGVSNHEQNNLLSAIDY